MSHCEVLCIICAMFDNKNVHQCFYYVYLWYYVFNNPFTFHPKRRLLTTKYKSLFKLIIIQ